MKKEEEEESWVQIEYKILKRKRALNVSMNHCPILYMYII